VHLFSSSMFFLFFSVLFFNIIIKKNGGEDAEILHFLLIAFQILHVFLPDTLVHCTLIEYANI
jgi:hypothetical protein